MIRLISDISDIRLISDILEIGLYLFLIWSSSGTMVAARSQRVQLISDYGCNAGYHWNGSKLIEHRHRHHQSCLLYQPIEYQYTRHRHRHHQCCLFDQLSVSLSACDSENLIGGLNQLAIVVMGLDRHCHHQSCLFYQPIEYQCIILSFPPAVSSASSVHCSVSVLAFVADNLSGGLNQLTMVVCWDGGLLVFDLKNFPFIDEPP